MPAPPTCACSRRSSSPTRACWRSSRPRRWPSWGADGRRFTPARVGILAADLMPPSQTPHRRDRRGLETQLLLKRYARGREQADRERLAERFEPLARSLAMPLPRTPPSRSTTCSRVASLGANQGARALRPRSRHRLLVVRRADDPRRTAPPPARPHVVGARPARPSGAGPAPDAGADELSGELGRPPTIAELAERLGTSEEIVLDAREAAAPQPRVARRARLHEDQSATLGELLGADDEALGAPRTRSCSITISAASPPAARWSCACASRRTSSRARDRRDPGRLADARLAPHPPVARATAGGRRRT